MSYVGIDVSKAFLDVAFLPNGEVLKVGNDTEGIACLVDYCEKLIPEKSFSRPPAVTNVR